ncbi:MAG: hypothetical protein J6U01_09615 [Clostridia bacterium]|nr:hypothetical protein [Clostridia bacterium]
MKRIFSLILVLVLLPIVTFAVEPLSETEQRYLGGWSMYAARNNGNVFHYSLTLTEDRSVYLRTLTIENGVPDYNTLSSGTWEEFLSGTIYLTLSGKSYVANILDGDYLKLMDGDSYAATGYFSRCQDMAFVFGE